MEGTVVLAASGNLQLVNSYNDSVGKFFSTGAGDVIAKVMAVGAVLLALALIGAGVSKLMGRQNSLVTKYFVDGKVVFGVICAIIVLAGPIIAFPLLLKVIELIINAVFNTGQSVLGAAVLTHTIGMIL